MSFCIFAHMPMKKVLWPYNVRPCACMFVLFEPTCTRYCRLQKRIMHTKPAVAHPLRLFVKKHYIHRTLNNSMSLQTYKQSSKKSCLFVACKIALFGQVKCSSLAIVWNLTARGSRSLCQSLEVTWILHELWNGKFIREKFWSEKTRCLSKINHSQSQKSYYPLHGTPYNPHYPRYTTTKLLSKRTNK